MKVGDRPPSLPRIADGAPAELRAAIAKIASKPGVTVSTLGDVDGAPIQAIKIDSTAPPGQALKVLITGGVHGNEGVGPAAAIALAELVRQSPELRSRIELTVVPCVNPEGYADHTRQNENDHLDLNREFIDDGSVPHEVQVVEPVLQQGPFALAMDLHASQAEDQQGNAGFFAIEPGGDVTVLQAALARFGAQFPLLDQSTERYERLGKGLFRSQNQGTLKDYVYGRGTPLAYTFEAPTHLPYSRQVDGMIALAHSVMSELAARQPARQGDGFDTAAPAVAARGPEATPVASADPTKLWG